MSANWTRARESILTFCHRIEAERLVYATAGNVSCRIEGEPHLLAVTPTSTPYDTLQPDDIVIVTLDGEVVDGHKAPTSELPMHTLICKRRPEVGAVIHTHSVGAMTMCNLGWKLPAILTGLVEAAGGDVLPSPYALPESAEMADFTEDALRDRGSTFMRFHGLLSIGADLDHAFRAASVVEGACQVYLQLRQLDVPIEELPAEQVEWIASFWRAQFPGAPAPLPAPR